MPSNFESMSIKEKTNAFNKFTIDERLAISEKTNSIQGAE